MARQRLNWVIYFTTFLVATGGILFEIFLGAFGSYLFGDSVKVFGLTMGFYMFSMGVGAFLIKPEIKNPLRDLFFVEILLVTLHLLSPIIIWQLFVSGYGANAAFWTTLILSGILVGSEIPLILGVLRQEHGSSDRYVHSVLAADYFGALVASLLFGGVLLTQFGMLGTASVSALLEASAGLLLAIYIQSNNKKDMLFLLIFFLLFTVSISVVFLSDPLQKKLEQSWVQSILPNSKFVHTEWTGLQQLNLVEFSHPTTQELSYALFLNRQFQWSTGRDLEEYHEMLGIPAVEVYKKRTRIASPLKILILGGGDGFLASLLKAHYEIAEITVVDYDPQIKKLSETLDFWKRETRSIYEDKRVKYQAQDAFQYVIEEGKKSHSYDLIFFDLPDPTAPGLARFYTPYFFNKVSQILKEKGVVAIQASYTPQTSGGRLKYVCSLQNSLQQVGFSSKVLAGDELDYYLVTARGDILFPQEEEKMPGRFISSGFVIRALFMDHLSRFGENCKNIIPNSLLKPQLLDI